jgi:microcystin degradation protein MlrC
MRIAIAMVSQETGSFTSLRTTLDDFRRKSLYEGPELVEKTRGVGALGGFLEVAEAEGGVDIVPIIGADASAGGIIAADAADFLLGKLASGLRRALPVDGVFMFLHGGSAAENEMDPEGALLAAARAVIGPRIPMVVAMDHHAKMTGRIANNVDALVAFRTQPHDVYDTGVCAARILFRLLKGEISPTLAWLRIPMVTHQEQFLTTKPGPMKEWFDLARRFETLPKVISASTFPMQPWLDVPDGGWAAVVITDNDPLLARKLCAELANKAWSMRSRFLRFDSIPLEQAVSQAVAAERGLVILSDTGDSVFGGAAGASTVLLREMLRQKVACPALMTVYDTVAARRLCRAGLGEEVTLPLGATEDSAFYDPVTVTGRVAGIVSGRVDANVGGSESFDMGKSVLLEVGSIKIVVSEYIGIGGNHPIVYERFGIEPSRAKMAVLKTASNFQYFSSVTSQIIRVDTPGPTMSHLERFRWQHLPRPIYPLDDLQEWKAG